MSRDGPSRDGASSGLFDGFQIFGKTDSSFSVSKEDSKASHGKDTRMTHSMYNFQNHGNHNTVDPEQPSFSPPQSLPARSQHQEKTSRPSRQRLSSLPSTEESNSPQNQQNKPQKNKHKSSPHQEKPPSLYRTDHLDNGLGSDPALSPLQVTNS